MSPKFLPISYNGGDVSGGCTMYIFCEETKCCRNTEKWSAEYYMVKNVWDNLIIYTTPYISYTKYISPWKKAWRGTNRWRVHWCRTRAHNGDTRLNVRSEEPAGVRWWKLLFFQWEHFSHRGILYWKKEKGIFFETFFWQGGRNGYCRKHLPAPTQHPGGLIPNTVLDNTSHVSW